MEKRLTQLGETATRIASEQERLATMLHEIESKLTNFDISDQATTELLRRCCDYIEKHKAVVYEEAQLRKALVEISDQMVTHIKESSLSKAAYDNLVLFGSVWESRTILGKAIKAEQAIHTLERLRDEASAFEKVQADERLANYGSSIQHWYELLHPNEKISFMQVDIVPGHRRHVALLAHSYGTEASVPALLSESHINAVGLSVYLSQLVQDHSPYRFVVIDDPVQSMDQAHQNRFARELLASLLKQNYQIIVLSHLKQFIRNCQQFHRVKSYWELGDYKKHGPVLKEKQRPIEVYWKQFQDWNQGDDASQRTDAAAVLRKLCERFCKEVYIRTTGQPLPAKYRNASYTVLRKLLFKSSCGITQEEVNILDSIASFGNPAHHDDQTREPPTRQENTANGQRLHRLIRKFLSDKL